MRLTFLGSVAAIAALVAACASEAPRPSLSTVSASAEALAACRSSANALCTRTSACSPAFTRFFFGTEPDCEAQVADRCLSRYEGPGAAAVPATCADDTSQIACGLLTDVVAAIPDPSIHLLSFCPVTPGTFALGAKCLRDGDCASGWCQSACGTCGELGKEGKICGPNSGPCERSLRCLQGGCRKPLANGESCLHDQCGDGFCDFSAGSEPERGVCRPYAGRGEACTSVACDTGKGLVCNANGVCEDIVLASVGAACVPLTIEPGKPICDATGWCSPSGVCQALGRLGDPCDAKSGCMFGLLCRGGACRRGGSVTASCE